LSHSAMLPFDVIFSIWRFVLLAYFSIRRWFQSTFFLFDVLSPMAFSSSTYCASRRFFHFTSCLISVFFLSTFCPSTFLPSAFFNRRFVSES
jgi:hypothetical protein